MKKFSLAATFVVSLLCLVCVACSSDKLTEQPTLATVNADASDSSADSLTADTANSSPCDDNNPCTADTGTDSSNCSHSVLADGDPCDDGNKCTTGDICLSGECVGGDKAFCSDGNDCTVDVCDPNAVGLDGCKYINSPASTTCDDGDKCTSNDFCKAGVCVAGPQDKCDDNDLCTTDTCDPTVGCAHKKVECSDGNQCTTDSCDQTSGKCVFLNNSKACNDADQCHGGDQCVDGACVSGTIPKDCDDVNPCTKDSCDPSSGCKNQPIMGQACDDGNSAIQGDVCGMDGICAGIKPVESCDDNNACTTDAGSAPNCTHDPVSCDDGNPCTGDSCDPKNGCMHIPLTTNASVVCSDNDPGTTDDVCVNGTCKGTAGPCDDGNACTVDTGNSSTSCTNTAIKCDDGNPCTNDSCDTVTGCNHAPNNQLCSDGDACTIGDVCGGGKCVSGPPKLCIDNNQCTSDACDPATGCVFTALTGVACSDGSECTIGDQCQGTVCQSGAETLNCDDGNSCTTDSCDPVAGCKHAGLNGPVCDDGQAGTVNDQCQAGMCIGSDPACSDGNKCTFDGGNAPNCTHTATVCDDGNPCTDDSCDPATGCTTASNSSGCDDGNPCTSGDKCSGGSCASGPALNCDDGVPSTADACDINTGNCSHTFIVGCGTGEICGNGIDDDNDGFVDCADSECGPQAEAYNLQVYASAGGSISVKVPGVNVAQDFQLQADTPGVTHPLKITFNCADLPFAARVISNAGPANVWVLPGVGNVVAKSQQFDVWIPWSAEPTANPGVAPSLKWQNAINLSKGFTQGVMVAWPPKP